MEIVGSRKCNLMNLKRVEVFLELPEKTLTIHYEELLEDDIFEKMSIKQLPTSIARMLLTRAPFECNMCSASKGFDR